MSKSAPKVSSNARGRRSREAILREAGKAFSKHGYRGVSMASIAADVGITEPGLLHHFNSKPALLLALLEDRYHADGSVFADRNGDVAYDVLDVLLELVQKNELDPVGVRLFTVLSAESVAPDHPAHDYFARRYARVRSHLAQLLTEAKHGQQIRQDVDVDQLARLIIAVMDGLQVQWLLEPGSDMASTFRMFTRILADDIRGSDDPPA